MLLATVLGLALIVLLGLAAEFYACVSTIPAIDCVGKWLGGILANFLDRLFDQGWVLSIVVVVFCFTFAGLALVYVTARE
jgi:hypothetical protein